MRPALCLPIAFAALLAAAPARADRFMNGVDASYLPQVEAAGGTFRDDTDPDGETLGDALAILRAHGVTTIRIRVWHTPTNGAGNLTEAVALAGRAAAGGFDILLDLHYSDTWADPGHQAVPAAWAGLELPVLADSVRLYTRDVVRAFAARGATPRCVQLGNEITAGMLWDTGRVGGAFDTDVQWDRLARLLQAGIDGLDEAVAGRIRPQVMIHLDRGGDNAGARRFLDRLASRDVRFDVIGLSYYPWWHGSPADLAANLGDLAVRYGKDIIVVETAYPWTLAWRDNTHNIIGLPSQLLPAYPASPEGQRGFLDAMLDIVHAVPDGRGIGVFWWGAEWIAAPGFGSSWENLALFDGEGRALPALSAFGADPQKR
jgi:arabinogalactan endo-1,4-beta-galactosidase